MTTTTKEPVTMGQAFLNSWNNANKVKFNPNWMTTKDYPGRCVWGNYGLPLASGALAASTTDDGRRILIAGSRVGNIVILERFVDDPEFLTWVASPAMVGFIGDKARHALDYHSYKFIIGYGDTAAISKLYDGLGVTMDEFYQSKMNKYKRDVREQERALSAVK